MADNYWDSEERFVDDEAQDVDDDARLDTMSDLQLRALAEFNQLCDDDAIFAEMWNDSFDEWFNNIFLPLESEG